MNSNSDNGEHPEKDALGITKDTSTVSPGQPEQMDRAAAFVILGLKETADAYAVDNRFWQLTKRFRSEKNEQKLLEVTKAYEVASGRAAEKQVEQVAEDQSPKFFGKSNRQWKVFFYYTWWKILLAVFCVVVVVSLAYQMITGGNYDIKIVSIGHFSMDNTNLTNYSVDVLGYQNPYISSADLVADGSEAENSVTMYGAASAAAFLGIDPDVIIFDATTLPYYLSSIVNMDAYYETLRQTLPKELLDKITPVTCTIQKYKELIAEEDEEIVLSPGDEVEHIYGLQISDPVLIAALGYSNEWASQKASLVFSVSSNSTDVVRAQDFITAIIENQDQIAADYQKTLSIDEPVTSEPATQTT